VTIVTQNYAKRRKSRKSLGFLDYKATNMNVSFRHRSHRHSSSVHSSRHRAARELQDAELQRAIQLSLEEAGLAQPGGRRPGYVPYQPDSWQTSEPPLVDRSTHPSKAMEDEDDPDLKAAIEASLREANAPRPSAPIETPRSEEPAYAYGNGPAFSQSYPPSTIPASAVPKLPNYDLEPLESDAIMTFSQTVEQVQSQGNRDIYRYPAVGELYDRANGLRPKLAMSLDDTGRKERESRCPTEFRCFVLNYYFRYRIAERNA
jgi:hepatocyte growth factor-regulated tyrosine kinase substrate